MVHHEFSEMQLTNVSSFVQFKQASTNYGYLTTAGSNVQMNFTGQHRSSTNNNDIFLGITSHIGLIVFSNWSIQKFK